MHNYNIIYSVPIPMFVVDNTGIIIAWNRAIENLTGILSCEMLGKDNYEYSIPFKGKRCPMLVDVILQDIDISLLGYDYYEIHDGIYYAEDIIYNNETYPVHLRYEASKCYPLDNSSSTCAIQTVKDVTTFANMKKSFHDNQEKLRSIFISARDMIFIKDKDFNYTMVNPSFLEIFQLTEDEVIGKNFFQVFNFPHKEDIINIDKKVINGETVEEEQVLSYNNKYYYFDTIITPLRNSEGSITGICGIARDITQSKETENLLRVNLEKLGNITSSLHEAIIVFASDYTIKFCNQAASSMFKFTNSEIYGSSFIDLLIPLELHASWEEHIHKIKNYSSNNHLIRILETTMKDKYNMLLGVEVSLSSINIWEGENTIAVIRDVHDRIRKENLLIEQIEKERRNFAQDLHDNICQYLSGISMLSELLHNSLQKKGIDESSLSGEILQLLSETRNKLRFIIKGSLPVDFSYSDLISSLENFVTDIKKAYNITMKLLYNQYFEIDDIQIKTHIYYIIHESVFNIVKHANATEAVISLSNVDNRLYISIYDDGIGITEDNMHTGAGITIMKYRANAINAMLDIQNLKKGGTRIFCIVPYINIKTKDISN